MRVAPERPAPASDLYSGAGEHDGGWRAGSAAGDWRLATTGSRSGELRGRRGRSRACTSKHRRRGGQVSASRDKGGVWVSLLASASSAGRASSGRRWQSDGPSVPGVGRWLREKPADPQAKATGGRSAGCGSHEVAGGELDGAGVASPAGGVRSDHCARWAWTCERSWEGG